MKKKGGNAEEYCFIIDTTNSDPTTAVTYFGNNADYTPARMNFTTGTLDYGSWENAFFQPRPVMLKYDGTVDYELDHNDFTKKLDGTASDVSNTSYGGNCMIGFPQIWLKFRTSDTADGTNLSTDATGRYQYIFIASENVDGEYHCYTHQNKNGTWLDEIFIMAYEPSNISNKLRSLAGQTILQSLSGVTMQTYAKANGNAWDFMDFGELQMIQMLCILLFKSLDTQGKIGAGVVYSNNSASTYATTGTTKDKGMFYAKCNDGTSSNATTPIKVFGIENLWGNRFKWINGFLITSSSSDSKVKYKLCDYTTDGSTATAYSEAGTGYKTLANAPSSNVRGYIKKLYLNADGLFPYPDSSYVGGTASTYYCDYQYLYKPTSYTRFAYFGGTYINEARAGLFFMLVSDQLSDTNAYIGASLSCKPY